MWNTNNEQWQYGLTFGQFSVAWYRERTATVCVWGNENHRTLPKRSRQHLEKAFLDCNRQHRKLPNGLGLSVERALGNTRNRLNMNQLKAIFDFKLKLQQQQKTFPRNFFPDIAESLHGLVVVSPASGQLHLSSIFGGDTENHTLPVSLLLYRYEVFFFYWFLSEIFDRFVVQRKETCGIMTYTLNTWEIY